MSRVFKLNSEFSFKMSENIKTDLLVSYKELNDKSIKAERDIVYNLEMAYGKFNMERDNLLQQRNNLFVVLKD